MRECVDESALLLDELSAMGAEQRAEAVAVEQHLFDLFLEGLRQMGVPVELTHNSRRT